MQSHSLQKPEQDGGVYDDDEYKMVAYMMKYKMAACMIIQDGGMYDDTRWRH